LLSHLKSIEQLRCTSMSWTRGANSISKNELIFLLNSEENLFFDV
jgi:hypothetical protein